MKYQTLFTLKNKKNKKKVSSAAVVRSTLRVKYRTLLFNSIIHFSKRFKGVVCGNCDFPVKRCALDDDTKTG